MRLLIALIIVLLTSTCATPKNTHTDLRKEMNTSIREGFGDDAIYYLDTLRLCP
jgi:hypothetical protein